MCVLTSVLSPDNQKKKVTCILVCLRKRQRRWTLCVCACVHLQDVLFQITGCLFVVIYSISLTLCETANRIIVLMDSCMFHFVVYTLQQYQKYMKTNRNFKGILFPFIDINDGKTLHVRPCSHCAPKSYIYPPKSDFYFCRTNSYKSHEIHFC